MSEGDATLPIQTHALRLLLIYEVHAVMESSWILDEAARVLEPGGMLVCSNMEPSVAPRRGVPCASDARSQRACRRPAFSGFLPRSAVYPFPERSPCFTASRCSGNEGFVAFPFTRDSDSQLIDLATGIVETRVGLTRLPSLSPWVLTVAATAGPTEVR